MSYSHEGMHWTCEECKKQVYRHHESCSHCGHGLAPWASPEMRMKVLSEEVRPDIIPGDADG